MICLKDGMLEILLHMMLELKRIIFKSYLNKDIVFQRRRSSDISMYDPFEQTNICSRRASISELKM